MIKEIDTPCGYDHKIYCDSCYVLMFKCGEIYWDKGQELLYCPILCEKCGTESSKFMGYVLRELDELKK